MRSMIITAGIIALAAGVLAQPAAAKKSKMGCEVGKEYWDATDGKCNPDPSLWKHRVWKQLGFSVDDPHYYSYRYQSDGKTFKATAYADLDCDGQASTFTLEGSVGAGGDLETSIRVENELE